jgi:hypothetical protein
LDPKDYPRNLPDQHLEDLVQEYEAAWIVQKLAHVNTVLELGYGSGIIANALVKAGKDVTVVDGAPFNVAGATCIESMFEDFTPIHRYGAVIASFVLEHVEDPQLLLRRCRQWAGMLIAVVGNANSIHRQLAVKMGLQANLNDLSARDHAVGHHRVYTLEFLHHHLVSSGWNPRALETKPLFFKPLPNSMMTGFSIPLLRAMNEIADELPIDLAANIGVVAQ